MRSISKLAAICFVVTALSACQSAYYGTLEKVGIHKRDILVDRVEETQESQEEAQEQFVSALEQFRSVVEFDGGELEDRFDKLNDEFEKSEEVAEEIRSRIAAIEDVAEDLFSEWEGELDQYSSKSLRRESQRSLKSTQQRYEKLIVTMRQSETRLNPVLDAMRDQVLYLKHNLNARAVRAVRGEIAGIDKDVDALLASMQKSIAEADDFVNGMREETE
ncbi:MAG: DUF2959 domain-containing protein [Congregibacter sp.]